MEKSTYDSTNYKVHKLSSADHIRFLNYHDTIQQEIATCGATIYLQTDATGACTYQAPNVQLITQASHAADERFFQHPNLQMNLLNAQAVVDANADPQSLNNLQVAHNQLVLLRYDPLVEDPRQKFFEQKLFKCRKEATEATTAVTHVFKYLFSTLDSFLCSKLQVFASRTDPAHPPHVNLVEGLQFLRQELKGQWQTEKRA